MQRKFILGVAMIALSTAATAQLPTADLAKPPAGATHYIIQSTGGKHGDSWRWTAPDGARMARESINLRGQVFELDSSGRSGNDGMLLSLATATVSGDLPGARTGGHSPDRAAAGAGLHHRWPAVGSGEN